MTGRTGKDTARPRQHWWAAALLAVVVLLPIVSGGASSAKPQNVHPAVYQWAMEHPGQPVPVLVRINGDPEAVAKAIEAAGGTIGRKFQIVSALEAVAPREAIAALASADGVAFVSLDAPVQSTGSIKVDLKALSTTYPLSVDAGDAWSQNYTGSGIGVAVVDTGISPTYRADFAAPDGTTRVVAEVAVNPNANGSSDGFGHGTHVAGIVGGYKPKGKYVGVAPEALLINVKIADDSGASTVADAIAGLEWVAHNRETYNIRVVNLSLHATVPESYWSSPLDAAVEALWFKGIFVVVAAGNLGGAADAVFYPPANDPFVMTVGAIDDRGTSSKGDDVPAPWSSAGVTQDGFAKPELLTPGAGIVSTIDTSSYLYQTYPSKTVDASYFRLSGTSMAAGVMSGVAALVLERHPDWTPGQLKCSLMATARTLSAPFTSWKVPRAGSTTNLSAPSCNSDAGVAPSMGFAPMVKVGVVAFVLDSANAPLTANVIGFPIGAVGGPGTTLDEVDWSAIKWDAIKWDAIKWDAIKWDAIKWDAIKWDAIKWDAIKWDAIKWDAIKWDAIKWDAIKWDAIKWDAIKWDLALD